MLDTDQFSKINPYNYSKMLIPHNVEKKKLEQQKKTLSLQSKSIIRHIPRVKSALLFDAEKELKRVTLSSKSFSNYMKMSQIKTSSLKNRQLSSFGLIETEKGTKSQRMENKKLPNLLYKKIENNFNKKNIPRKSSFPSDKKIKLNHTKKIDNNYINFNNISSMINKEEENSTIKETPYGFKYKETRIIYDKSKINVIKSAIFNDEKNLEYNNITEFTRRKSFKENFRKSFHKANSAKKEKEKNNTFKFFLEGDFLYKNKNYIKSIKKKEFLLKNEEAINYLNELYEICKDIEKFNAKNFMRKMKFNLKLYYHKEDFSFEINLLSICLKFIKQDELKKENKEKPQKIYLPFTYLLFFCLLDFEIFKIFLSEILIYNEELDQIEINNREIKDILVKYKKYIQFNLGAFFNKEKNQEKNKEDQEKYNKITYNCNEGNYLKIYDWIVHINKDKYIIYKVQMILPLVKFNLYTRKVKVKKYIHKNIIINLLKANFENWEEKILCDLFLNKKFRYIMNSLFSQKEERSGNTRKIFLNKIEYNQNFLNKNKYEFFITDVKKEHSRYLYISSYEILFFYGRTTDAFIYRKHINFKDSININKFNTYWGYMNTILKCLYIDKNKRKVNFDFKILENSPKKFFNLKSGDNAKLELHNADKNNKENLKNFYNQGFMTHRREDLLIDICLFNFILVEPCIVRLNLEKYYFKIPKDLLNIMTKSENSLEKMNIYISQFRENLLINKSILNINYEEIKRKVLNKNLSKNMQDRLKTLSMGVINKSNTFKTSSIDYKKQMGMKRGISSGFGSLFGKSLLNLADYKKSNTKKFGGSILINMQRIDEIKTSNPKKENMRISMRKKHMTKKIFEERNENKEISHFNNDNIIATSEEKKGKDNASRTDRFRFSRKKTAIVKSKFSDNAGFFKDYIDHADKEEMGGPALINNRNKSFIKLNEN